VLIPKVSSVSSNLFLLQKLSRSNGWLAKVGYERVQEIENPELATKRTRMLYKLKGYPDDWIEKRMRGIAIREELTDEWQNRGTEEQRDYGILTAEIYSSGA